MAVRPAKGSVTGGLETGRLGGNVRQGSRAYHRKAFTQSARVSMDDIIRRYSTLINSLKTVTPQLLEEALEPVLERAKEYCPVASGALMHSGAIAVSSSGSTVRANVNFGGPGVPYAAIVHERMDLHHAPPGRAKFLQSAMEESLGDVMANLAVLYAIQVRRA